MGHACSLFDNGAAVARSKSWIVGDQHSAQWLRHCTRVMKSPLLEIRIHVKLHAMLTLGLPAGSQDVSYSGLCKIYINVRKCYKLLVLKLHRSTHTPLSTFSEQGGFFNSQITIR